MKVLLDNRATDLFINTKFTKEKGFKLEKLKTPLLVKNIDRTVNVGGAITYQVEYNVFFKEHIERAQMDVYNLGKTEMILDKPWLVAYNLEIDWEKGEIKMTWCSPIYRKRKQET